MHPQAARFYFPPIGWSHGLSPTLELWGPNFQTLQSLRRVGLVWGRRTPVPPAPAPFDASRGPTVLIGLQRGDKPEPHGTTASFPVPWAQRDGPFPRPPGATRADTTQRGRPEADGAKGERQGGAPRPHGLRPRFPDPTRAGVAPTGRPEVGVAKGVGPSEPHGPTASTRVGAALHGHPKAVVAKGVRPRERHGPTVSAPVPQAQRGPAPPRAPPPNPRWPGGGGKRRTPRASPPAPQARRWSSRLGRPP